MSFEFDDGEYSGLFFAISSPNKNYIFAGMASNNLNSIDYNMFNDLVKIVNNSSYLGSVKSSNSLEKSLDISKIKNNNN